MYEDAFGGFLGFFFASSVFPFMILFFLVSAFSFIASVTVIDDHHIPSSQLNLHTSHGLDAVKFRNNTIINQMTP